MNGSGCHSGDSVARQALKFLREQTPNPEIHLEKHQRNKSQVLPGAGTHLEKYQNKPRLSHVWGHSWRSIRLKFLRGTNPRFSHTLGHTWRSTSLKFLRGTNFSFSNAGTQLEKNHRNKPQVLQNSEIRLEKHQPEIPEEQIPGSPKS